MSGEPIGNEPRPATLPGTTPDGAPTGQAELPDYLADIDETNPPVRTDLTPTAPTDSRLRSRRRNPDRGASKRPDTAKREVLTPEQKERMAEFRRLIRNAYRELVAPADAAIFGDYPTEEILVEEGGEQVKRRALKRNVPMKDISLRERIQGYEIDGKTVRPGEYERRFLTDVPTTPEESAQALLRLKELLTDLPTKAKPIADQAITAFGAKVDEAGIDRTFVGETIIRTYEKVDGRRRAVDRNVAGLIYLLQDRVDAFPRRATEEAINIGTRYLGRRMDVVYDRIKKATTVRWNPLAPKGEFQPIVLDSKLANIRADAGLDQSIPEAQKVYDTLVRFISEQFPSTVTRPTEKAAGEAADSAPKSGGKRGTGRAREKMLRTVLASERLLRGDFTLFVADAPKPAEATAATSTTETTTSTEPEEKKAETKVSGRWVSIRTERDLLAVPGIFTLLENAHQAVDKTNAPKPGEVVDVVKERDYIMQYIDALVTQKGIDPNQDLLSIEMDISDTAFGVPSRVKRYLPEYEIKQRVVKKALRPVEFKPDNISARNGIEAKRAQVALELGKSIAASIEIHIDRVGGLSLEEIDNLYWGFLMRGYDEEPAELQRSFDGEASEYDKKPGEKDEDWRKRRATMIQERKLRVGEALGVYTLSPDKQKIEKIDVPAIAKLINEIQADARYISAYRDGLEKITKRISPSITRALRPLLTEIPIQERAAIVEALYEAMSAKVRQLERKSTEWKQLHGEADGRTRRYADVMAELAGKENQAKRAEFIAARRKLMLEAMGFSETGGAISTRLQELITRINDNIQGVSIFDTPKPKQDKRAGVAQTSDAASTSKPEGSADAEPAELGDLSASTIASEEDQPDQDEVDASAVTSAAPANELSDASGSESSESSTDVAPVDEDVTEEMLNASLEAFKSNAGEAIGAVVEELLVKIKKPDGSEYAFAEKRKLLVALDDRLYAFERAFASVAHPAGSTGEAFASVMKFVGLVDNEGFVNEGAFEVAIKQLLNNPEEEALDAAGQTYIKNADVLAFSLPSQIVDRVFKDRGSMKDRLIKSSELSLTRSDVASLLEAYAIAAKTHHGNFDVLGTFEGFIAATKKAGDRKGVELLQFMKIAKRSGELDPDKTKRLFVGWLKQVEQ